MLLASASIPSAAMQVMLTISTMLVLHMSRMNKDLHAVGKVDGYGYYGHKKTLFVMLMGHAERIETHLIQFFADFNIVIVVITH